MGNSKELIERLRALADILKEEHAPGVLAAVELIEERDMLERRLSHLLSSETISMYDMLNCRGEYAFDISALDKEMEELDALIKEKDERAAPAVQYICDRRACEVCNFECKYTEDIRHAKHFELFERTMFEQEG